jgi:hypothetical protein
MNQLRSISNSFVNTRRTQLVASKNFINSNSIIAKFAFIIMVLLIFVILLRLGSALLSWMFSFSSSPTLVQGMIDAKQMIVIPQDPSVNGSIPILRSVNDPDGIEFTWSVWFYNDDFSYKRNEYKHIFHKGNDNINLVNEPIGMNFPNNAPGLYITPNTNNLAVVMNSFNKINDEIIVKGIPINKWVNVIIRLNKQLQLDVYINGTLSKRHQLKSLPKQNYGDVYVAMNGGFSGYISELKYFSKSIGTSQIQRIVKKGPSMKMNTSDIKLSKPSYLSTSWHINS